MSIITEVRREREDLARVLKKHAGIRKIVEDLYPDNAHFIYELLQNAEDTCATKVTFTLTIEGLTFEHNGRFFDTPDTSMRSQTLAKGLKPIVKTRLGVLESGLRRFLLIQKHLVSGHRLSRLRSPSWFYLLKYQKV